MRGRWNAFCSSLPQAMSVGPAWFRPTNVVVTSGAPARAYSSYQITCSMRLAPRPPYSRGHETPAQPPSNIRRCQARSYARSATRSAPTGRRSRGTLASSQARASARNASSAALKRISTVPRTDGLRPRCRAHRGHLGQDTRQLLGIDRLQQVDVEAGSERAPSVLRLAEPAERHEKDLATRGRRPQLLGHLVAVESGETDVDERDFRVTDARHLDGDRPVLPHLHAVSPYLEQRPQRVAHVGAVLDHQHVAGLCRSGASVVFLQRQHGDAGLAKGGKLHDEFAPLVGPRA